MARAEVKRRVQEAQQEAKWKKTRRMKMKTKTIRKKEKNRKTQDISTVYSKRTPKAPFLIVTLK